MIFVWVIDEFGSDAALLQRVEELNSMIHWYAHVELAMDDERWRDEIACARVW